MKNGRYFMGFVGGHPVDADYIAGYTPVCVGRKGRGAFFAEDVKEWHEDFFGMEYDPKNNLACRESK